MLSASIDWRSFASLVSEVSFFVFPSGHIRVTADRGQHSHVQACLSTNGFHDNPVADEMRECGGTAEGIEALESKGSSERTQNKL